MLGYGPLEWPVACFVTGLADTAALQGAWNVWAGDTEIVQHNQEFVGSSLRRVPTPRLGGPWLALVSHGYTVQPEHRSRSRSRHHPGQGRLTMTSQGVNVAARERGVDVGRTMVASVSLTSRRDTTSAPTWRVVRTDDPPPTWGGNPEGVGTQYRWGNASQSRHLTVSRAVTRDGGGA